MSNRTFDEVRLGEVFEDLRSSFGGLLSLDSQGRDLDIQWVSVSTRIAGYFRDGTSACAARTGRFKSPMLRVDVHRMRG